MRVGMIAPPWFPVPPPAYGGTEAVVSLLTEGLVAEGVDVTLFASGDSTTRANLSAAHPEAPSARIGEMAVELEHVLACLERAEEFDLVHDHSGLLALTLAAATDTPFVHTVHGPLTGHSGELYRRATAFNPDARLIALTDAQRAHAADLPWLATCGNAVEVQSFPFSPAGQGYLAFLGRMSPEKGAREAIAVARAAGLELRIAAKCREPAERAYFDAYVAPALGDGVEYLGELGHRDKARLLAGATALVFPIDWEEPFGLVLIEAASCGTPVVATRRGSVPEVVEDGVTGLVVDRPEQMPAALRRVASLDRVTIRRRAEERFSPRAMLGRYLAAYERALAYAGGPVAVGESGAEAGLKLGRVAAARALVR
jgi:glycosyltransferase involved in cell wall biosynthesis